MPKNAMPGETACRALADRLGWSVTCNRGGWIRLWDAAGQYQGKRQGWAAAYAYLLAATTDPGGASHGRP